MNGEPHTDNGRQDAGDVVSAMMREPTDAEAVAAVERAREIARNRGSFDSGPFTSVAEDKVVQRLSGLAPATEEQPAATTWEPICVTASCGQPLGYRAKSGAYGPVLLCAACGSASVGERLRASGITFMEMDEPLSGLIGTSEQFQKYMAFLERFAKTKPQERHRPPFAFVYGSNGVGKSAGAQRALRDAIKNGCQGRFVTLSMMLNTIYSTYGAEHADDMLVFYQTIHLLVVDEVGHEHSTDHAMTRFYDVVNARLSACLPTIFTANFAPTEESLGAQQRDGEARMHALLDRLAGGAGENVFCVMGKSRRRAAFAAVKT